MIDAVLSYHMNPLTCGVAKFNHQLAERLGVRCISLSHSLQHAITHALVSIKLKEIPSCDVIWVSKTYDLLLHDRPDWIHEHPIGQKAQRIWYADELGCPSTIQGNASRGSYRVLTFGMAHKRVLPHFVALKEQLARVHPDYTISLSTAVHEGSPWDVSLAESESAMRDIFGDRLRVLGFLTDDALARELQECDAVAAFFSPALRANNTSAWAAIEAGKPLYTNTDGRSPALNAPPTWDALVRRLA